jgi:hypothetical protein
MLSDQVEGHLNQALATMRSFVDQAETSIAREAGSTGRDPGEIIGQVQAKLAWGMANAASCIQDALYTAAFEREHGDA